MNPLHHPSLKTVTLALLLGGSVLVTTACAESAPETTAVGNTQVASTSPTVDRELSDKSKHHVEARVKTLHRELKITPDQEALWAPVADVMRENETAISALIEARHAQASTATAVDDIKSYQAIAQAHADGILKFEAVFEPLYKSLSDDQKKSADALFSKMQKHAHPKSHKKPAVSASPTK